uniref:Interleukin 16 n=1 Tax=Nothobranchius kadleci TaxID=1051664 RepID=A0A1A8EF77_NOTKA
MDLSLLAAASSENGTRGTGACFTVRSASPPSFSFTRRSGIRRRETAKDVREEDKCGTRSGPDHAEDMRVEEKDASGHQMSAKPNQNGTAPEDGADGEADAVFENRGRTHVWKSYLLSRSQSLDWRSEARSPVQSTRTDQESVKGQTDFSKQVGSLKERRFETGVGPTGRGTPADYSNLPLDWTSKVHSLPSRFRSEPGSKSAENPFGPKGGRSIQERIQKLYKSAGEKTEGGTFPRRFSSGDKHSPVQNRASFVWTQSNTWWSGSLDSSEPKNPKETSAARQRPLGSLFSEHFDYWEKEKLELGTKSLDRARSRNTKAAQIRSARTVGEVSGSTWPQPASDETSSRSRGRTSSLNPEILNVQGKDDEGANALTTQRSVAADEDVFEADSQKITMKAADRSPLPEKLSSSSSAGVRNKISQFEALTQKATSQSQMPRRTFSVPAGLHRGYGGVKKSESVKEIGRRRDRWEEMKEGENKTTEKGKKIFPVRSLSVDEVGLRLGKTGSEQSRSGGKDKNDFSVDFDKYSRAKKTLHIPLNEETRTNKRTFYFDETDFGLEDKSKNNTPTTSAPSSFGIFSSVRSGDQTPTNIPDDFVFGPQPKDGPSAADGKNERTSGINVDTTEETNSSHLPPGVSYHISGISTTQGCNAKEDVPTPLPASDSESSTPDVFRPDVKTDHRKGKKQLMDLSAWVASLNPEYQSLNDCIGHYEDDDQSTQKDDDSDSGDSSVTITSSTSQSDRRSFSISLSDLCNFSGVECESENNAADWEVHTGRTTSMSSDMSTFSCVSLLPTEELDQLLEDVRSLGDETLQDYNEVQVVVLHKEEGVGLGFSLAGGVDQNKPITVHKVFPSGVAAQEGSVREGYQVLSINGTALSGTAHSEALRVLRKAKARDMAVVVLKRGGDGGASVKGVQKEDKCADVRQETGQRVCMQLQKIGRDLGFSLQGGVGSSEGNRPLTIQKIFQGGPVDKVFPGDEVLEIKGTSLLAMRRLEVWTFIRGLPPGPVEVVLRRPHLHQHT